MYKSYSDLKERLMGVCVVMTTAFQDNYELDKEGIRRHTRFLIDSGIKEGMGFLVPTGSTGECPSLRDNERKEVMKIVIDEAKGEVPVVCGCNHTDTRVVIELAKFAQEAGADGVMISPPYYWKPTEDVVLRHYRKIAEEIDLGIMVYNNWFATQYDIPVETLEKLADIPNIVALKENSSRMEKWNETCILLSNRINILAGNGDLHEPFASVLCSKGIVSGLSNFIPKDVLAIYQAEIKGDLLKAKEIHNKLLPLAFSYKYEDSSCYIAYLKEYMNLMNIPAGPVRFPLVELSEKEKNKVREIVEKLKLGKVDYPASYRTTAVGSEDMVAKITSEVLKQIQAKL